MSWKELCNGYGIQKIPMEHTNELQCQLCGKEFHTRHLYTTESIAGDGTLEGARRLADKLRTNCYCKRHMEWLYAGAH